MNRLFVLRSENARFGRVRVAASLVLAVLVASVFAGTVRAQSASDATDSETNVEVGGALHTLRMDVGYLASDLLEGRETGTDGERLAARYVVNRFAEIGLSPGFDGAWMQAFEFTHSPNPHAAPGEGTRRIGRNVVGRLDVGAERTIVVGAHYDHLGYGGFGSRAPGDSAIHNGADDNASGVAALLEIARRLSSIQHNEGLQTNVLFVAFSGEELGLYGSKHFVDALPVPKETINYMINLDMVGRLGPERTLAVNGRGTSPAWGDALQRAATETNLTVSGDASGLGASDHTSFYLEDVPSVHLFTGAHSDYHTPSDDSHRINYAGLHDVATFAVRLIEALDDDGALPFTETDDGREQRRMSFKVSLGIMPDYVFEGDGMRIDVVLDDRPAAQAGLKDGDVIVRLGETDVDDIYAYMEALQSMESGQRAPIVVKRDGKRIETTVQF